jgi:hypothetical protein
MKKSFLFEEKRIICLWLFVLKLMAFRFSMSSRIQRSLQETQSILPEQSGYAISSPDLHLEGIWTVSRPLTLITNSLLFLRSLQTLR